MHRSEGGHIDCNAIGNNRYICRGFKNIRNAEALDNKEHMISFGKDWSGKVIKSDAFAGNINNGSIPSISNRFADIHIHTDQSPPSSGDIYGFIDEVIIDSNYIRYVATPNGLMYALILTNKQSAINFNLKYPRRPGITVQNADGSSIKYQPTFPQILVDEFDQIKGWGGASKELATAFLLAKYNTGVALLKEDDDGSFRRLITKETKDRNGNKIYTAYNCE
ncbi:hypothetical protein [Niabella ginsengisoli]|uniref:Uncharacterized protein n=1 Tax=Niabella ginsengisoli TaxID=522298 RepID=A0ABS9SFB9_9BACT|nr:hypothetical protein [Niabella ginsengisoli]MCH5597053.1 hypothetical protein [Niabella ginsengisoli]